MRSARCNVSDLSSSPLSRRCLRAGAVWKPSAGPLVGVKVCDRRSIAAWRPGVAVGCSAVMFLSASQIRLDAASSMGKCPRDLMILRSLASSHQARVLQGSSPGRTCASSYLIHSDLMRRVMPHSIAKRSVGSCGWASVIKGLFKTDSVIRMSNATVSFVPEAELQRSVTNGCFAAIVAGRGNMMTVGFGLNSCPPSVVLRRGPWMLEDRSVNS